MKKKRSIWFIGQITYSKHWKGTDFFLQNRGSILEIHLWHSCWLLMQNMIMFHGKAINSFFQVQSLVLYHCCIIIYSTLTALLFLCFELQLRTMLTNIQCYPTINQHSRRSHCNFDFPGIHVTDLTNTNHGSDAIFTTFPKVGLKHSV